jgi:hypothetical protein
MPQITPQQRNRLIAAGLAAIIGVSSIAFRSDEYTEHVNAAMSDAGVSRTIGNERTTDLMTGPVEPGAAVKSGVSLPLGARASDVSAAGFFDIELVAHVDRVDSTWLEVTARNRTGAPVRFVAFVTYSLATDGGL